MTSDAFDKATRLAMKGDLKLYDEIVPPTTNNESAGTSQQRNE